MSFKSGLGVRGPPLAPEIADVPLGYEHLEKNVYVSRPLRKLRRSQVLKCDCVPSPDPESADNCGPTCVNKQMAVECLASSCECGALCQNQRFERMDYPMLEVFGAGSKGRGLRTLQDMKKGDFVIEYVGEVLDLLEFRARAVKYDREGEGHFFFMLLDGEKNEYLDATRKANHARFINHSCAPNCATEKWTVGAGAEIRIGIFVTKDIKAGTELTFDYMFERYGSERQTCLCGEEGCRGFLGGEKEVKLKEVLYEDEVDDGRPEDALEAVSDLEEQLQKICIHGTTRLRSSEADVVAFAKLLHRSHTPIRRIRLLQALIDGSSDTVREKMVQFNVSKIIKLYIDDALFEAGESSAAGVQLSDEIEIIDLSLKVLKSWPVTLRSLTTSHVDESVASVLENSSLKELDDGIREAAGELKAGWQDLLDLTSTRVPKRRKEDVEREKEERRQMEDRQRREKEDAEKAKREFQERLKADRRQVAERLAEERARSQVQPEKPKTPDFKPPKKFLTLEELRAKKEDEKIRLDAERETYKLQKLQAAERGLSYSIDIAGLVDTGIGMGMGKSRGKGKGAGEDQDGSQAKKRARRTQTIVDTNPDAMLSLDLRGFRDQVSHWVTTYLQPHYRKDRFETKEDFKKCARYMTHKVLENESERPDGSFLFHPPLRKRIHKLVDKELSRSRLREGEKYNYDRQRARRQRQKEKNQKMSDE